MSLSTNTNDKEAGREFEDQYSGLASQASSLGRFWRQFRRSRTAVVGLVVAVLLILVASFAPYLTPYDPIQVDYDNIMVPPSTEHLLGTDWMGRDLLSRLIAGSRLSLSVGIIAVAIGLTGGGILGILAGFYPELTISSCGSLTSCSLSPACCSRLPSWLRWDPDCRM